MDINNRGSARGSLTAERERSVIIDSWKVFNHILVLMKRQEQIWTGNVKKKIKRKWLLITVRLQEGNGQ